MMSKGFGHMSFDQIMMQQAQLVADEAAYCRYCGMDTKKPSTKSDESDMAWEINNHAHKSCHRHAQYNKFGR